MTRAAANLKIGSGRMAAPGPAAKRDPSALDHLNHPAREGPHDDRPPGFLHA